MNQKENGKVLRKSEKVYGNIPPHIYKSAAKASLAQNFSDTVRLAVVLRHNGVLLSQLHKKNKLGIEKFLQEYSIPQMQENIISWTANFRPRYEEYTGFEAKMSSELWEKINQLSQEELEFAVKDTDVCIENLDKRKAAIQ